MQGYVLGEIGIRALGRGLGTSGVLFGIWGSEDVWYRDGPLIISWAVLLKGGKYCYKYPKS